jgi:beta-N-acetylglucosaminidase
MKLKTALIFSLLPTMLGLQHSPPPEEVKEANTDPIKDDILNQNNTNLKQFNTHWNVFSIMRTNEQKAEEKRKKLEFKRQQAQIEKFQRQVEHQQKIANEIANLTFNPNNVEMRSGLSAETLRRGLPSNMKQMAESIIQVEKQFGVNAIFISAIAKHESGNGTSRAFRDLNNAFGIGPHKYFSSHGQAVKYFGRLIRNNYLNTNGQYYNGKSVYAISIKYCQDGTDWTGLVQANANDIIEEIKKPTH